MRQRPYRNRGGFSLIELLVVILIISLLLTLGAAGLRGMGGGKGVSSAVTTLEALVSEARSTAIGKGTTARLLIDVNDPTDNDNYLRKVVIVYKELDKDGNQTQQWTVSSRATTLPEKVFFSKAYSKKDQKNGGDGIEEETITTDKSAFNGKYLYYEFNSQGICSTPGASLIVGTGARNTGEEPRVTGEGKRDFAGFVIWRNGHTSLFRNPDQMDLPSQITNF